MNDQVEVLQSIYGPDCTVEKNDDGKCVCTINLSNNSLLLQEKIEAKVIVTINWDQHQTTFEGTGFSKFIFLQIGELVVNSNKERDSADIYKLILDITEVLENIALKAKKEKEQLIENFKEQMFIEKIKVEREHKKQMDMEGNYQLNIQKYVKQTSSASTSNTQKKSVMVDYDNFIKNEPSLVWKNQMVIPESDYAVGTNGVYIAVVSYSSVNIYDTEKDVWIEAKPANEYNIDPSKCSIFFGTVKGVHTGKMYLTLEIFNGNDFVVLSDTEETFGNVDQGEDPKKQKDFRKRDDFFNSKFSKWFTQQHTSFNFDRSKFIVTTFEEGYIVFSGEKPEDLYLVKFLRDKIQVEHRDIRGHRMTPRTGFAYIYRYPNLLAYGGQDEDGEVFNDLYLINLKENRSTKLITFGPSPCLAFAMPLFPKGENEYLLFGGCDKEKNVNKNMYILNSETYEMAICNPGEEAPVHIKGTSLQAKGKLFLFGGQKGPNIYNKNVDALEFQHSVELSTKSVFGDYSKWFRAQNPKESDVVFYFGLEQKRIYAHKFIIQITCPKLYQYILEAEKRQKDPNEVTQVYEIFEKKVFFNVFGTFIEFLYSFSLHLDPHIWNKERYEMLLYLSEKFECKILEETIKGKLSYDTIVSSHLILQIEKYAMKFITGEIFGENPPPPGNGIVHFMFEDGPLYGHKSFLMQRSAYFFSMFDSVGFQESETGMVEMPEDISKPSLLAILEYLYIGKKPHVQVSDAVGLYYAISIYDLQELKPYLRSIISGNVTMDNVYDILYFADMLKDDYLCQLSATCLFKNYEDIKDTEEFKNVPSNVKLMVFEKNVKEKKKNSKKHK